MTTNPLSITQLTSNQNNKEVTINDQNEEIQRVLTQPITVTVGGSNAAAVTEAQLNRAAIVNVVADGGDPPTAAITVTFAAFVRGAFTLVNQTAQDVTATIAAQPATAPTVATGENATLIMDGTNVRSAGGGGGGGGGGTTINNTFNGPVVQSPFAGVLVSKSADQANVGAVVFPGVALTWDQETYDTDGFHDNVTNNTRLTIPSGRGIRRVRLSANVEWAAEVTDRDVSLVVRKNGAEFVGSAQSLMGASSGTNAQRQNVTTAPVAVVDGDYFEVLAWSSQTDADDVQSSEDTWFSMEVVEQEANATQIVVATPGFFQGALVSKTATQTNVGAVAFPGTALTWDTETYDTDDFHDNVTNNTRMTIPSGLGIRRVRLVANLQFNASTTNDIGLYAAIRKNGADVDGMGAMLIGGGGTRRRLNVVSAPLDVVDGDYFEVFAWVEDTTNDDVDTATATWFSIEVVEGAANARPGAAQNWAVPHRGARCVYSADTTINLSSFVDIPFPTEDFDTDNFFDGATPGVFTIPDGITKVRLIAYLEVVSGINVGADIFVAFRKNNSRVFIGNATLGDDAIFGNLIGSISSGVVDVTAGDTLEVGCSVSGETNVQMRAATSYFELQVVEASDSALRPFDVDVFVEAAPTSAALVYQQVLARSATLPSGGGNSRGFADTAPTSAAAFAITRNGVSVGTVNFAAAAQAATFTIASDVTFVAGDRLGLTAPSPQDASLADVSITLALGLDV